MGAVSPGVDETSPSRSLPADEPAVGVKPAGKVRCNTVWPSGPGTK